jgi:predicted GTPase
MGMTGSGKSSVKYPHLLALIQHRSLDKQFIKLITDDEGIKIGHGVASQTSDIGVHYWTARDGRLCALIDTPGFDDSNGMTDTEVLDKIASLLKVT